MQYIVIPLQRAKLDEVSGGDAKKQKVEENGDKVKAPIDGKSADKAKIWKPTLAERRGLNIPPLQLPKLKRQDAVCCWSNEITNNQQ